jgi:hypothetical protein
MIILSSKTHAECSSLAPGKFSILPYAGFGLTSCHKNLFSSREYISTLSLPPSTRPPYKYILFFSGNTQHVWLHTAFGLEMPVVLAYTHWGFLPNSVSPGMNSCISRQSMCQTLSMKPEFMSFPPNM